MAPGSTTVAPRRAMRSSVFASVVGKSAEMATLLLLAIVVPRVLGPRDYGAFAVPLTIVTLGSLALTLGGPAVMTRYVPAAPPADRVATAKAIGARLAVGRALQVAAIVVIAGGLAVARPDAVDPSTTAIVVAALVLNVAATLGLQLVLGLGRAGAWSTRYPLQNAVLIGAVLVLHPMGRLGSVGAILVAALAGAIFAATVAAPVLRAPAPRLAVPDGAVRFGMFQALGAALVQATHRGGVLVVAVLAGSPTESGYTALATGITLGVTYAVLQTYTVSFPHVMQETTDGDETDTPAAERLLRRLTAGLLLVILPTVLVAAVFLDDLVPRAFGADYSDAAEAFGPALALIALAPLASLTTQVASLRLRPEVAAEAGAAGAAVFAVVALSTVARWGATGATTAALAGGAAAALVGVTRLRNAVGGPLTIVSFAGAGLVVVAGAWA